MKFIKWVAQIFFISISFTAVCVLAGEMDAKAGMTEDGKRLARCIKNAKTETDILHCNVILVAITNKEENATQ